MTEDTAMVSWDPVQAVIDKYVVRHISADGESKDMAVPREQSSTILTGLKPGEAYKVYVWAEKGSQESKKADTEALTGNGRKGAKTAFLTAERRLIFESGGRCPPSISSLLCTVGGRSCKSNVEFHNCEFFPF